MLRKLTGIVIRFKWFIIVFWVLLAGVLFLTTPSLSEVARSDQASFLPPNAPSQEADRIIRQLFPDKGGKSSIVLVAQRTGGLSKTDISYLKTFERYMLNNKDAYKLREFLSPFSQTELEEKMMSKDKSVALQYLNLTLAANSHFANETVKNIRDVAKTNGFSLEGVQYRVPQGLSVYLTGSAVMSEEENESVNESMAFMLKITIVMVLGILIIIYLSPIAPMLPLLSIGLSFLISSGVVASLSRFGFKVSSFTEMFLIAVLFGAGTDYCLLMISRVKEGLAAGKEFKEALMDSVSSTGVAIVSSGGTVIIGFLFMIFAKFGLFNTTGPSVAIGMAVTLLMVLTFVPAVVAVLGRRIFWPVKNFSVKPGSLKNSFWTRLSVLVTSKPRRFFIITLLAFLPFLFFTARISLSYDMIRDLPSDIDSVKGFNIMKSSFANGEIMPTRLVIKSKVNLWDTSSLQVIDRLADQLLKVKNVGEVRTATRPIGEKITKTTLPYQIGLLSDGLGKVKNGFQPLQEGLDKVKSSIEKVANGMNSGLDKMDQISGGLGKTIDGLSDSSDGLGQLEDGTDSTLEGLGSINDGLKSLNDGVVQSKEGIGKSGVAVEDALKKLNQTLQANEELQLDLNFQTALFTLKAVSEGMVKLEAGLAQVSSGLDKSTQGITAVQDGMPGMKKGAADLKAGLNQMKTGLEKIKAGQDKAVENLGLASDSLIKISKGIGKGNDALGKMKSGIQEVQKATKDYSGDESALEEVFFLPPEVLKEYPEMKDAMENYIPEKGNGLVMDVILSIPPCTKDALDTIAELRRVAEFTLKGTKLQDAQIYLGGSTAAYSEVRDITIRDSFIVMLFVLSGIFLILMLMLRSIVAPVYLIFTILLSFASTMGICHLFFVNILGYEGLHWAVPFFAFCVLVALGVDYNIFLVSRIKEEYKPGDTTGSVARAVASTGGIITSCGIIMAGTFGAMLTSSVTPMFEIGFAAVVGLLIDTFIIRCISVPALAVIFGELNWWPGRKVRILPVDKNESGDGSLTHAQKERTP